MLLAVTVAVTGERIALLSLGLGLLVFVLLLRELRLPLLLAGAAAALLVAGTVALSPDLRARLIGHTAYDLEDFWGRRYGELFLRSVRIWQSEPVIGIGLKNFRLECANDHFLARGPVEDRCYTHPHHIYLEWLVESGAIGFAGFLGLLLLWGRDLVTGLRRIDRRGLPDRGRRLGRADRLPLAAARQHELLLELERHAVLADARPRAGALRPAAGPPAVAPARKLFRPGLETPATC